MQEVAIAHASQDGASGEELRSLERRLHNQSSEYQRLSGELQFEKEEGERLRNMLLKRDSLVAILEEQVRALKMTEGLRSRTLSPPRSPPRSLRTSPQRTAQSTSFSPPTIHLGTPQRASPAPENQQAPNLIPTQHSSHPSSYSGPVSRAGGDYGLIEDASHSNRMLASMHVNVPEVRGTFPTNPKLLALSSAKPTYYGELEDGWPHGRGITVWADGRVYDGHWNRGVFSGMGTCVWYNGDTYEGEWHDGFAHGLGRYTFVSGDIYGTSSLSSSSPALNAPLLIMDFLHEHSSMRMLTTCASLPVSSLAELVSLLMMSIAVWVMFSCQRRRLP